MGGALAVHTASLGFIQNLAALVVIDVVEGQRLLNNLCIIVLFV
jgi:hypothetical protein